MKKIYVLSLIALFVFAACSDAAKSDANSNALNQAFTLYSKTVKDSFYLSVQLPEAYNQNPSVKYPTVYTLDANFYFPMLAAILKEHEKAGLLPPLILVGIGYKSFQSMDSLRERDYLYPASIPSDEMKAVGGGKNFSEFITNQLIPYIDASYPTQKTNRALLGHSFGGYFSLYALLNQINNNQPVFTNFAAASPSLWYNDFYLNQLTDKLKNRNNRDSLNIFMSVGGLEDSTWNINPVKNLGDDLLKAKVKDIKLQYKVYSDLDHMDVATITFIKALQAFYQAEE